MKRTVVVTILAALSLTAAQAITVTTTADSGAGSLRQAVAATSSGGSIDFNIPKTDLGYSSFDSTYRISLTNEIQIGRDLTINGPTNARIVIDGTDSTRIFNVFTGNVKLSNLSLVRGLAAGTNGANEAIPFGGQSPQPAQPGGDGSGGAILNNGILTIHNCTFSGNQARGGMGGDGSSVGSFGYGAPGGRASGGAVANFNTLALINCTLMLNSTTAGAGGSGRSARPGGNGGNAAGGAVFSTGNATFINCTFYSHSVSAGNGGEGASSSVGGNGGDAVGGVFAHDGAANSVFRNTIIAGGSVTAGNGGVVNGANGVATGTDVSGTVTSEGHNLIGRTDGSDGWIGSDLLGGTTAGTSLDPLLGPLEYNRGSTPTLQLNPGSAAIDAGDDAVLNAPLNLVTDQRGFPRKLGLHVDIGAHETGPLQTGPTFIVTHNENDNDGNCTSDDCTLREAISAANANADSNTITFAPGLSGEISSRPSVSGYGITQPVAIIGPGARLLTISGGGGSRIFSIASANVTISGLTLSGGFTLTNINGAGVYNSGSLTLRDCMVSSNRTVGADPHGLGGGAYNAAGATLNVVGCTFRNNSANQFGGGIYSEGILNVTNSTFTGNSALRGGGIISRATGGAAMMTLRNCTITGNTATDGVATPGFGGGGVFAEGNSMQYFAANNIFAGNTSTNDPDVRGNFTSHGHNLIGSRGDSTGFTNAINGDLVGTIASPLNAQFGGFGNYGGPTDTRALLGNSPAINAGNNALAAITDQRGYPRVGASDIGAFEFGSGNLRITNIARTGNHIAVRFVEAVSNQTYRLERKMDLSDVLWQSIPALPDYPATATGGAEIIHTGGAGATRSFYRVRLLP